MLRTFIQVFAVLQAFFASFLLVRGSFALLPSDIAKLCSTYFGWNESLIKSFTQQQWDTKVGVALLMLSVILQMINLLWPMRICDFGVNKKGAILAIVFSVVVFVSALKISDIFSKATQKVVIKILNEENKRSCE